MHTCTPSDEHSAHTLAYTTYEIFKYIITIELSNWTLEIAAFKTRLVVLYGSMHWLIILYVYNDIMYCLYACMCKQGDTQRPSRIFSLPQRAFWMNMYFWKRVHFAFSCDSTTLVLSWSHSLGNRQAMMLWDPVAKGSHRVLLVLQTAVAPKLVYVFEFSSPQTQFFTPF